MRPSSAAARPALPPPAGSAAPHEGSARPGRSPRRCPLPAAPAARSPRAHPAVTRGRSCCPGSRVLATALHPLRKQLACGKPGRFGYVWDATGICQNASYQQLISVLPRDTEGIVLLLNVGDFAILVKFVVRSAQADQGSSSDLKSSESRKECYVINKIRRPVVV